MDYARRLVQGEERDQMAARLEKSPPGRRRMVSAFSTFHELCRKGFGATVPEVTRQRGLDAFRRPLEAGLEHLPVIASHLITPAGAPAGVRSSGRAEEALYEAGRYWVDLRLSKEYRSRRTMLVGQIADRQDPSRRIPDLMVLLMTGADVTSRGVSNHLGEFAFECDPARPQHLLIPVPEGRLELPLPKGSVGRH